MNRFISHAASKQSLMVLSALPIKGGVPLKGFGSMVLIIDHKWIKRHTHGISKILRINSSAVSLQMHLEFTPRRALFKGCLNTRATPLSPLGVVPGCKLKRLRKNHFFFCPCMRKAHYEPPPGMKMKGVSQDKIKPIKS